MPEISAAEINSIRLNEQGSDPATPASGYRSLYAKADGLYTIDSAGGVLGPIGGGRILTLGRSGTLTATAGTMRLYVPWSCTIQNVTASVGTAPTGADLIVDVNLDGSTIFSTQGNRPTIAASAYADLSSTPDTTAISADSYLTVDVDQIGSTVAGADLVVQLEITIP